MTNERLVYAKYEELQQTQIEWEREWMLIQTESRPSEEAFSNSGESFNYSVPINESSS